MTVVRQKMAFHMSTVARVLTGADTVHAYTLHAATCHHRRHTHRNHIDALKLPYEHKTSCTGRETAGWIHPDPTARGPTGPDSNGLGSRLPFLNCSWKAN